MRENKNEIAILRFGNFHAFKTLKNKTVCFPARNAFGGAAA